MDNITLEQQNQLKTWADERDAILRDISIARSEKEILTKDNNNLRESNAIAAREIISSEGRMIELDKKEGEYELIVSSEIANLLQKKTNLETVITALEKEVLVLSLQKEDLSSTIATFITMHDHVYNRVGVLNQVVDRVTRINAKNIDDVNALISKLKVVLSNI